VFEQQGFLDKFVGDAVMAVFGVPFEQKDHVHRAVRSAMAIKIRLAGLNRLRAERGERPLECGIGIHCGPAAAGYIGAAQRANYTVVGHTVNLASRIQNLAQDGEILLTDEVRQETGKAFGFAEWRTADIRGVDRPVRLFQVLDAEGSQRQVKRSVTRHDQGTVSATQ
jgi:adenylate cyclase